MLHRYFIKTPWWIKKIFSSYVWNLPRNEHAVYLTFDDGPDPEITPWVLEELERYHAKATFFCVGENVKQYPEVYHRILDAHHATGNHSHTHPNGWYTEKEKYLADISEAAKYITTHLFRPPYGRIRAGQAKGIPHALQNKHAKIIMWDVLSADFDLSFSPQQCLDNVLKNVAAGSIIVFHDSQKAGNNLKYALPRVMKVLHEAGYEFRKIE